MAVLRYLILLFAKRFSDYESLGELFQNTSADSIQLTISENIWLILCKLVKERAEIFEKTKISL